MSLTLLTMAGLGLGATYYGFKKKDPSIQLGSCFFERLGVPLYTFFNEYHSNSGLLIDAINEESVVLNTPLGELYGIELRTGSNIHFFLDKLFIDDIISSYKNYNNATLYYVMHKQEKWHKQYLFSYNPAIIKKLSSVFQSPLLSGKELLNVIHDLYLQNSFYVDSDKKNIFRNMTISQDTTEQEPEFMSFKRAVRQSLYKSLNDIDVFQGFKNLERAETNLLGLFHTDFEGSLWFVFDFNETRIKGHINKLINETKLAGNKKPFLELKDIYNQGNQELVIVNAIGFLKKYSEDTVSSLGSNLKTAFIPRDLFRNKSIKQTLLKQRDIDFDFLVKAEFLNHFIASCHKKITPKADIYGIDKNGGFVNFSFSAENNNPHSVIIARPGSGKSVAKQKIMSQMIKLDFNTGKCHNLGSEPNNVKIRSYDIGFSDENFIKVIKNNPENSVAHIESSLFKFRYNLITTEMTRDDDFYDLNSEAKEAFIADTTFATELASLILEESGGDREGLSSSEKSSFRKIIEELYIKKDYHNYRIQVLEKEHQEIYNEILSLGYLKTDYIANIKEEKFAYLKRPLLGDAIKVANIYANNQQLKGTDREVYASLAGKLDSIQKLDIFSTFDKVEIADADVISMDLNNFKESSLFIPIFFSIFQKTYLRDREFAIKCRREKRPAPKLFYAIEEAKNFFRDSVVFEQMFDKVTLEARKYNVHLCFIVQNADHIPSFISKNIDTRMFLLEPGSKLSVQEEADKVFSIPDDVREAIATTDKYELCIWYKAGVFHMKFEIPPHEMRIFNTNPNEV